MNFEVAEGNEKEFNISNGEIDYIKLIIEINLLWSVSLSIYHHAFVLISSMNCTWEDGSKKINV